MPTKTPPAKSISLSISDRLAARIADGDLMAGDRLPSEAELALQFDCSRATVREALKRLAAKNLIRTARGHSGGAFVADLTYAAALDSHVATSMLLLSMNAVDFQTAAEARFALERACVDLAVAQHDRADLRALKDAINRLASRCTDEAFCAADVAFHRALVDAGHNPVLSYQLAGAVEAMQPLMNMITFSARSRARIVALHARIADALEARDAGAAETALASLEAYTIELADDVRRQRAEAKA